ncbi:MAG: alcohol dehydrogenase catalytic domain-containing protein [Pirellulales bacterium]|nr:alcohol dehydrogenase catalytic domain-containing protein [Pirellulales bacterium]
MKAVLWTGGETFELQDVPEPIPRPGQIVVKVHASAICGTDFHYADFKSQPPIIPGHEVAGVIVDKSADVGGLTIGEAVAINPVQRCGTCYACENGIGHLCLNTRHLGGEQAPGGWAEYVTADAANAHLLPRGLSFAAAALTEPVAVCYQSFLRAQSRPGQEVLILGDGPFGFLHAVIAKLLGAKTIFVAGHYDERLRRIAEQTRAVTCNSRREDLLEIVRHRTGGLGVDLVIEATGSSDAPNLGIAALRPRGTLVIFSYIWKPCPPDFGTVSMKELNLVGSCRSRGCFDPCLAWMAEGKIPAEKLVDLRVPLAEVNLAITQLKHRKKDIFKAVLLPNGN